MKERKLKVYAKTQMREVDYRLRYKEVPEIILSGEWLTACGFNIANKISVEAEQGQIIIRKTDTPD